MLAYAFADSIGQHEAAKTIGLVYLLQKKHYVPKKYPFYYVGGYAVSPDRYDYRISFDDDEEFDYACWFDYGEKSKNVRS